MPVIAPNAQLATALKALKKLQDKHHGVVESAALPESARKVLLRYGYLQQVMKGWYICSNPVDKPGDTTAWYATFWPFTSGYLKSRFGNRYCLNPEASLLLHTGNTTIPRQVTVVTADGGGNVVKLPFDHSLLLYPDETRIPRAKTEISGLQVWSVAEALCLVAPNFFTQFPKEAQIAIQMIRDVSEVLPHVTTARTTRAAAQRLAGAFDFVGRKSEGERIIRAISTPDMKAKAVNPFEMEQPIFTPSRERSPYVLRLRAMWQNWRQVVIDNFPPAPGLVVSMQTYLSRVEDRYATDAYNSLSIEGYQVTDELIARVASGEWSPELNELHKKDRDTLAARGYYRAFQAVKHSLEAVLEGQNSGLVVRSDHHTWFGELFEPSVAAGILKPAQLLGYRTGPVYLRNSQHTPVPRDAILDSLEELWRLIEEEPHACVRAVLGHHLFVFIHPYYDGNGRCGRFLMNVLLASGGYPWTVVRMASRAKYMAVLEEASVREDIKPLVLFLRDEMQAENGDRPPSALY